MKKSLYGIWKEAKLLYGRNGLHWTIWHVLSAAGLELDHFCRHIKKHLEEKHGLYGSPSNSLIENYRTWNTWDWSNGGEEWMQQDAKCALTEEVVIPFVQGCSVALEIGPGAGKWSEILRQYAKKLILIDISDVCLDLCQKRFSQSTNIVYRENNGKDLSGIEDCSVDRIWSYDVFVHIRPEDIQCYLHEMKRVLRSGGKAIIHHADNNGENGGWRTQMNADTFRSMVEAAGLVFTCQFRSWGKGKFHFQDPLLLNHQDVFTSFENR